MVKRSLNWVLEVRFLEDVNQHLGLKGNYEKENSIIIFYSNFSAWRSLQKLDGLERLLKIIARA